MCQLLLLASVLLLATLTSCQKILVYNPKYAHSHSNFLGNMADVIAEAGMDVTSLIPQIYPAYADGTKKSKVIHVPGEPKVVEEWNYVMNHGDIKAVFSGPTDDPTTMIGQLQFLVSMFTNQCNFTINQPGLLEKLRKEKFDVVISENFDHCGHGIFHLIKAKSFISVSSTNIFDLQAYEVGMPLVPSSVPGSFGGVMKLDGSITERLWNMYTIWCAFHVYGTLEQHIDEMFVQNFGPNFPKVKEVTEKAAFVFTSTDPFVDFARPTIRKVVDLGGISVRQPKPLDKKWLDILSLRKRNVIVSFGSVARSYLMPEEYRHAIAKALASFPDTTFIWKYERENDTHTANAPNVILTPWLPQNDLLADSRVVGMITHAGKGSVCEIAERGVPSILVPLFADQLRNAGVAIHLGFGFLYEKNDLSNADKLTNAIRELLETPSYHENARRMKEIIAKRPFTPQELLVKHVKFAAEVGPIKALEPMGHHYSHIVYFNIDIILLVFITAIVLLSSIVFLCWKLCRVHTKTTEKAKKH